MRRIVVLPAVVMAAAVMLCAPSATSAAVRSWSIVATPDASGSPAGSYLERFACATATKCWAAGFSYDSSFTLSTLMERWNGTAWTLTTTPDPGSDGNQLWSVACASSSECWAVGQTTTLPAQSALILEWTGTAWNQVTAADPSSNDSLNGVTCVSTTDCWAVGYQSGNAATLIEHWNGTAWSATTSPNGTGPSNLLNGVSCASANECWAVGTQTNSTLIEKWDGTAWSLVTSANNTSTGITYNDLADVTCAAANDCWAVGGSTFGASGATVTLVEHWDGSAWTLASSPNVAGTGASSYVQGVACMTATDCWAVGSGGAATTTTLIEQWNGAAWAIVTSPNPTGSDGSELIGVSCTSSTCWSVGDSQTATTVDTLAEEYTAVAAAAPTSTPTPTPTASPSPSPTPTASPSAGTISVPSAGAPPGAAGGPATPLLALAGGAVCVGGAALSRRRRRR